VEKSSTEYRHERQNIWEIERFDVQQTVRFGGQLEITYEGEIQQVKWVSGQTVRAVACDIANSGYNTFTTNCLRRWKCIDDPQISLFVIQDYKKLKSENEKTLYIKQRYFYISSSLKDIIRRYKKRSTKSANFEFDLFPLKNSFVIFEPCGSLAVLELLRLLIDEESLSF